MHNELKLCRLAYKTTWLKIKNIWRCGATKRWAYQISIACSSSLPGVYHGSLQLELHWRYVARNVRHYWSQTYTFILWLLWKSVSISYQSILSLPLDVTLPVCKSNRYLNPLFHLPSVVFIMVRLLCFGMDTWLCVSFYIVFCLDSLLFIYTDSISSLSFIAFLAL